jgi:hypothetical protein
LIRERWDRWLETSRLNPIGLLRMPWPRISPEEARSFDELLASTPWGSEIAYGLLQPKWVFLHHLVRNGYVLHGSNEAGIAEFRTRQTYDAYQQPIDAVFATDDAIWPMYFAVVRREGLTYGYINWCVHVRDEARYLFSIGRDPRSEDAWSPGTIYILPVDTFSPTRESRELVSLVPVLPRARLAVEPDDFPFRRRTMRHGRGATPSSVVRRAALTRHRRCFRLTYGSAVAPCAPSSAHAPR